MRQLLLLLTLLLGLMPGVSQANGNPCITFYVPYRTLCDNTTHTTKVQGLFNTVKASPVFNSTSLAKFLDSNPNNSLAINNAATYLLQASETCDEINNLFQGNFTLFGFPAELFGPVSGIFNSELSSETSGTIQIYFINVGCGDEEDIAFIPANTVGNPTTQWVDLPDVALGNSLNDDQFFGNFKDQTLLSLGGKLGVLSSNNGQGENCCITLIIPYRTTCVRLPNGTDIIRFQILTDTLFKKLTLVTNQDVQSFTDSPPLNYSGNVPFFQATDSCFVVDSKVVNGKLFGYPAQKFGPVSGQYTLTGNIKRCGEIQVYLLDCGCGINQDVSTITQNVLDPKGTNWGSIGEIPLLSIKSNGISLATVLDGIKTSLSDGAPCSDCVSLLVPYRVVCTKVNGKDVIKVQMLVDSAVGGHNLILKRIAGDILVNQFINVDFTATGKTQLLQATDSCKDLNTEYAMTQTINGNPAVKYGPTGGTYISQNCKEDGNLQVFFLNVGFNFAFVESAFATNDTTTPSVKWVDLDNNGTVLNITGDQFITNTIPTPVDLDKITVSKHLTTLAKGLNHDTSCATNPFNLTDEYSKGLLCRLVDALKGCPQPFTAEGTHGSCGDSRKVKLSGTMTKPMVVDICGKKFCLTSVPSVVVPNAVFMGKEGMDIVTCLAHFFTQYINYGFTTDPLNKFAACGRADEIVRLINGREFDFGGGSYTLTLHLRKVKGLEDTYDFILIEKQGNDAQIYETGCRFKIAPCSPCCK